MPASRTRPQRQRKPYWERETKRQPTLRANAHRAISRHLCRDLDDEACAWRTTLHRDLAAAGLL